MNIKNSQVVSFINGTLAIQEKSLPIKIGYAIRKNLKMMEPIAAAYEEERKKILDEYAEKDGNGEYVVKNESYVILEQKAYEAEMQELLEITNELELHKIPYSELEKCDLDKFDALSVQDIALLEIMVE